eukprot:1576915-Amphidinium_carterae.2
MLSRLCRDFAHPRVVSPAGANYTTHAHAQATRDHEAVMKLKDYTVWCGVAAKWSRVELKCSCDLLAGVRAGGASRRCGCAGGCGVRRECACGDRRGGGCAARCGVLVVLVEDML